MLILMISNTGNFPCELGALVALASMALSSTSSVHCLCAQEDVIQPLSLTVLVCAKDNDAKGGV
jgi:hypothetical protein